VQLQGFDADHLAEKAEQSRLVPTTIPAVRGQILDRDGHPLAYTVAARTIFADPTKIVDAAATAAQLAPLLRKTAASLLPKLVKKRTRYVPLAKDLSPADAARVLAAGLPGIAAEDTTQRLYPGGTLASAVVGYTNADGGLGGIESKFETALAGIPGKLEVERGSNGLQIPGGVRAETAAVPGSTVQLTIDEDLQFTAQRALDTAVRKINAQSGQIVVLDARTAEVLAMATAPTYDAQDPSASKPDRRANPAVQAPVEPGSANKVVTFAAAVDKGKLRPDTPMLVPDGYKVANKIVSDAWSHAPTRWTATGVLAKSSNVGTLMIAHDLVGPQTFYDYERRFGIGEKSGIELPGESAGILPPPDQWSGTTFGNLPIGQGVSMTPLQLAGMYQTIANDGVRVQPRIVKSIAAPDGTVTHTPAPTRTTVVSSHAARTVRTMLEAVVGEGGTAPAAALDEYRVAGKTGTAQKPDAACRCYAGGYWATFAGLAPADAPELVISIVIDQGKGGGHGGAVAGPLFKEVMSYGLTARKVAPTGTPRPTQKLTVD
jgi:cell division protein FtsI (penicillin-binding protein 3)